MSSVSSHYYKHDEREQTTYIKEKLMKQVFHFKKKAWEARRLTQLMDYNAHADLDFRKHDALQTTHLRIDEILQPRQKVQIICKVSVRRE